jgi:hypothetical protein
MLQDNDFVIRNLSVVAEARGLGPERCPCFCIGPCSLVTSGIGILTSLVSVTVTKEIDPDGCWGQAARYPLQFCSRPRPVGVGGRCWSNLGFSSAFVFAQVADWSLIVALGPWLWQSCFRWSSGYCLVGIRRCEHLGEPTQRSDRLSLVVDVRSVPSAEASLIPDAPGVRASPPCWCRIKGSTSTRRELQLARPRRPGLTVGADSR